MIYLKPLIRGNINRSRAGLKRKKTKKQKEEGNKMAKTRKTLVELTKKEFQKIPLEKRIATQPTAVQVIQDREKAIAEACPIDHADAYLILEERTRAFADLFGEKVFFDNWREDFDRIAAAHGYPRSAYGREYVQAHGYGELQELKVVYVAYVAKTGKNE